MLITETIEIVTVTIPQQDRPNKLTDSQKLVIDMYFNDGQTKDFLLEFFLNMYPESTALVKCYIEKKFQPKLLTISQ